MMMCNGKVNKGVTGTVIAMHEHRDRRFRRGETRIITTTEQRSGSCCAISSASPGQPPDKEKKSNRCSWRFDRSVVVVDGCLWIVSLSRRQYTWYVSRICVPR